MEDIIERKSLKEKLDEIDDQTYKDVFDSYYESRKIILVAMWDKGGIISAVFRGVKTAPSYRQLSKETSRDDKALKKWHDIYKRYPDKQEYIKEIAEPKARAWTDRALKTKLKTETPKLPPGKFRIIYADPPWKYRDELIDSKTSFGKYGAAGHHYPQMSIDELCELPVKGLIGDNAVLFLWVTSPLLDECFEVIKAWGFEYKTNIVWDKQQHNFGHYTSVRHEHLLICTKGACTPDADNKIDSVISIKRSKKHSEKPEEFRNIIDDLYVSGRRIELFARMKPENAKRKWDTWGDEIG